MISALLFLNIINVKKIRIRLRKNADNNIIEIKKGRGCNVKKI